MRRSITLLIALLGLFSQSCSSTGKLSSAPQIITAENDRLASAPVIVYKTTEDFSNRVPVTMNREKTQIISYPDPSDLLSGNQLTLPTVLINGYLLDNRGISENVVFLKYTYLEYSQLSSVPTLEQLKQSILSLYPLLEIFQCGHHSDYKNLIPELNQLITKGFPGCKRLSNIPMVIHR